MPGNQDRATEVHEFWFANALDSTLAAQARAGVWFDSDPSFDDEIRKRFEPLPYQALTGELDGWLLDPKHALSLVIVLDQFPRNLYRGSKRSFEFDRAAHAAATLVIGRGFDEILDPIEAVFLYLPFEHSEDLRDQMSCVELFRSLENRAPEEQAVMFENFTAYAERHREVIERFGRFPHRNEILSRESGDEERDYLASGGERF